MPVFSVVPLWNTATSQPASTSARIVWNPMNLVPPITSTRRMSEVYGSEMVAWRSGSAQNTFSFGRWPVRA
jgi:hypothetical protein